MHWFFSNCFTKTVIVGFEIDAECISKYQTFVFKAELNAFRDLPDNDYSLLGNIGTFEDTMKPFSFYIILINAIKSKQSNLSCAVKQGHDLYFSAETHFFGCYWRNKSSSLCGFPTAQGLDYVTFQAQNRNQSTFTKTVVVGFEIDAETRSKYQTFIFKTELNPFRDLPDNDNSLIGNIGSFADTMKPFSFV